MGSSTWCRWVSTTWLNKSEYISKFSCYCQHNVKLMALMNMTVNKGEKWVFFSQSEFATILSRVDIFFYGLYMYVHLQRIWFWKWSRFWIFWSASALGNLQPLSLLWSITEKMHGNMFYIIKKQITAHQHNVKAGLCPAFAHFGKDKKAIT